MTFPTVTLSELKVYMIKIRALFWIGRPYMWIFPISSVLLGMALTGKFYVVNWWSFVVAAVVIPSIINYFMVTFNAVFDVDADRINKPDRPLITGTLSRNEALASSLLSMVVTVILALAYLTASHVILLLIVLFMGIIYSTPFPRIKGIPILGNLWFGIGYVFVGLSFGWSYFMPLGQVTPLFLLVGVVLTVHATFISVSKDLVDYEGDRLAGYRTIPVVFGETVGATLVLLSLWIPIIALPFVFIITNHSALIPSLGLLYAIIIPWASYETIRQFQILSTSLPLPRKAPLYKQRFLTLYLFTIELTWGLILIFLAM